MSNLSLLSTAEALKKKAEALKKKNQKALLAPYDCLPEMKDLKGIQRFIDEAAISAQYIRYGAREQGMFVSNRLGERREDGSYTYQCMDTEELIVFRSSDDVVDHMCKLAVSYGNSNKMSELAALYKTENIENRKRTRRC